MYAFHNKGSWRPSLVLDGFKKCLDIFLSTVWTDKEKKKKKNWGVNKEVTG